MKRLTSALTAVALAATGVVLGFAAPASADATYAVGAAGEIAPTVSYNFDGDTGTTVTDGSGNGYHGAWFGTPSYSSATAVSGKAAQVNSANSLSSYFHLPVVAGKTDASSSFSYEFWINQNANTSDAAVFSNQNFTHCYNPGLTLYNRSSNPGKLMGCFGQNGTSTGQHYITPTGDSTSNANQFNTTSINGAWHYVAAVVDRTAGTVNYYLDGGATPVGTDTALTSAFNLNSGLAFAFGAPGANASTGATSDTGDGYTNAYVDDLNFYNAPITVAQIQADYAATKPAAPDPGTNRLRAPGDATAPYVSYDFDQDTASTVIDSAGQHHDTAWSGTSTYAQGLGGQGKAIRVTGSDGTVKLPLVSGKTDGSGSFSVVFWYGGESFTGDAWMLSNNTGGSCDRGFNLYHDSSTGAPRGCFGQTVGGTKEYQAFSGPGAQGAWHQIAGVVDRAANTLTWFQDGAKVAQTAAGNMTSATSFVTGLPFALGQNGDLSYSYDDTAWFDDLDFYTSAITQAQIQNDYNATKPASTALPVVPVDTGATTTGFLVDAFHAPEVRVGGSVAQTVAGLWGGNPATSYTKVDGDSWLSVSAAGVVTGTAPSSVPEDPATITVKATDGTTTSQITVDVPVIGATDPAQADAATWNLWDAGTHVDGALAKDLSVIATNGLDLIGVQEDGGTVAQRLATALGWSYYEGSGGGLGIVSAYPISSSDRVADTTTTPAVGVTVDVLGQPTRVWSARLDPANASTRDAQATAVAAAVQGGSAPTILLGDLESSSEAPAFGGLTDSFHQLNPASAGNTLLFANPSDRVDYVDYRGAALSALGSNTLVAGWPTTAATTNAWTSDHAAVVTTFAVGTGTTTPAPTAPSVTLAHGSATYQVGHGPSDLLGDLGASASGGATLHVTTDADYATAGDYTATVTASKDGATSDPALAVVHVVPVAHVTLSRSSPSLMAGTVTEATVLAATGASLNVPGHLHADLDGAIHVGTHPVSVVGTDAHGFTDSASATLTVTPDPTATPGAPAAPSAVAGDASATVTWAVPVDDGPAITGYTLTAYDGATAVGSRQAGPDDTSLVFDGLTNGTSYTFTVTATNSAGDSAASDHSVAVTPMVPVSAHGTTTNDLDAADTDHTLHATYTVRFPRGSVRSPLTLTLTVPSAAGGPWTPDGTSRFGGPWAKTSSEMVGGRQVWVFRYTGDPSKLESVTFDARFNARKGSKSLACDASFTLPAPDGSSATVTAPSNTLAQPLV